MSTEPPPPLPTSALALFAAARQDAPPPAVRDAVWSKIATTVAAPAAGTGAVAKAAGAGAGFKLLALGAVVGAVSAVAVFVVAGDDVATSAPGARRAPAVLVRSSGRAALGEPLPRGRVARAVPSAVVETATDPPESSLAEEARLVTEARLALVQGEAERALTLARSARQLAVRGLEPEELGLEARALRALGRGDEADATERTLRRDYPDHALAR